MASCACPSTLDLRLRSAAAASSGSASSSTRTGDQGGRVGWAETTLLCWTTGGCSTRVGASDFAIVVIPSAGAAPSTALFGYGDNAGGAYGAVAEVAAPVTLAVVTSAPTARLVVRGSLGPGVPAGD